VKEFTTLLFKEKKENSKILKNKVY